jgi:hypothetical protein
LFGGIWLNISAVDGGWHNILGIWLTNTISVVDGGWHNMVEG